MSMIDYDARPVTPQVLLVGKRASSVGYSIRDFLSRNGVPYEWVDIDDASRVEALLSPNSRYTGRTMQQTNFGRDYGFSVLGISRHGQTIQERPSTSRLGTS